MAEENARDNSNERERDRFRGRGRGAFLQFYEDMGTSSTEEGHTAFVAAKSAWEQKIAAAQAKYNEAMGQVNQAKSQYSQSAQQVNQAQDQYNAGVSQIGDIRADIPEFNYNQMFKDSGATPVRVVSGNNVEAVYNVPASQEYFNSLKAAGANAGYVDGGKNFNIEVKQGGRIQGQEVHEQMIQAQKSAEANARAEYERQKTLAQAQVAQARAAASGQASQMKQQIEQARATLQANYAEISGAESRVRSFGDQISVSRQGMSKELAMIKEDYKNKLQTVREVFLGTKTELGKKEVDSTSIEDVIPQSVKDAIGTDQVPPSVLLTNGELDPQKIAILEELLKRSSSSGESKEKSKDAGKSNFEENLRYES